LNAIIANRIAKEFTKDAHTLVDRLIRKVLETISNEL
jgi:hypothetical protein